MAHTTVGLDIGKRSVRYVLCHVDGQKLDIREFGAVPIEPAEGKTPEAVFGTALDKIAAKLGEFKKIPLDAVGLSVDPTKALAAHKVMPFNDPRILEQVLPQALMDIWKIDENAHIVFEVGDFVKDEAEKAEGEESQDGYDIHIVNYQKQYLADLLAVLKEHEIDPHVAIAANDAFHYLMGSMFMSPDPVWAMLDIGETSSALVICQDDKVVLSRSFKVGGAVLDHALAQAFEMSEDDARAMKEAAGFIAMPGSEAETYREFVSSGKIAEWEVDPDALAGTCAQAMSVLVSALRQSLINFVTKSRVEPACLYLVGGGAKLCGLDLWLSQNLGLKCIDGAPLKITIDDPQKIFSMNAAAAALAAEKGIDGKCPLNLRRGDLSHKGSLAVLQDNKWILASLVLVLICSLIFMVVTKSKTIKLEHSRMREALETTSESVFGKKLLNYSAIEKEIAGSQQYNFLPEKTAFSHFAWISSQVNDNLSDVEMDINSLDIDTQTKIVTIRGEVSGDEGMPKFMKLLEQYECFPNEIPFPKTQKIRGRTSFTMRVEATNCSNGGGNE